MAIFVVFLLSAKKNVPYRRLSSLSTGTALNTFDFSNPANPVVEKRHASSRPILSLSKVTFQILSTLWWKRGTLQVGQFCPSQKCSGLAASFSLFPSTEVSNIFDLVDKVAYCFVLSTKLLHLGEMILSLRQPLGDDLLMAPGDN